MSSKIVLDHLVRVEGHGGITVQLNEDGACDVQFHAFEGLRLVEGLVSGRKYTDVAQIVSRICSICSTSHTLTSLSATEKAFGIHVSPQTVRLRDLMLRGENIESHALHLFLLAMPDYLGYTSALAMASDHREAVEIGLRLKKLGNSIQSSIGGRAVHPINAVLGGFGKLPTVDQLVSLRNDLRQGLADCSAAIDILSSLPAAEYCKVDTTYAAQCSEDIYGYCSGGDIVMKLNETAESFKTDDYRSMMLEKTVPYSHAKLSYYRGEPFMVGALARLAINRERISNRADQAMAKLGVLLPSGNPMDNNKAQGVELVIDVEYALLTIERMLEEGLQQEKPIPISPRAATGTSITEAPRGLLVHSYLYDEDGSVVTADVITPTAMNAASIERHIRHCVEQSGEKDIPALTKKLEMVARAYDPCISCSVHFVR